jgi:YD repeat-containing protein
MKNCRRISELLFVALACMNAPYVQANERVTPNGTLVFDANGRMIAKRDTQGKKTEFSYDTQGRLIKVSHPDGSVENFVSESRRTQVKFGK